MGARPAGEEHDPKVLELAVAHERVLRGRFICGAGQVRLHHRPGGGRDWRFRRSLLDGRVRWLPGRQAERTIFALRTASSNT